MRRIRITMRRSVTVRTRVRLRRQVRAYGHFAQARQQAITTTARVLPAATASQHLYDDGYGPIEDPAREFDIFLSHATEDKEFTRPLAESARRARLVRRG